MSGIVGLPWDVRLSTLLTLGTGVGFTIADATNGFGFNQFKVRLNDGLRRRTPAPSRTRTGTLSLQKDFYVTQAAHVGVQAGSSTSRITRTYGCYDGFIAPKTDPQPNPNFGTPGCLVTQPRRLQVGSACRILRLLSDC